jgi:hypothetical protein
MDLHFSVQIPGAISYTQGSKRSVIMKSGSLD